MKIVFALIALFPVVAFATDDIKMPPPAPTQQQTQQQTQEQTLRIAQSQGQTSNQNNDQNLDVSGYRTVSVAQGSQVLYGCGASVNGGGSNGSDAGFLGFQWVTRFCKDAQMAAFYFGMGDPQTACDILRTGRWGKQAAKRGVNLPAVCSLPRAHPPLEPKPTVVVLQGDGCASNSERVDRVLEKCVSK